MGVVVLSRKHLFMETNCINIFFNPFNIQVPYEILNKKFRLAQKNIDREVSHIQTMATELEILLQKNDVTVGEVSNALNGIQEKLCHLKRKVSQVNVKVSKRILLHYDMSGVRPLPFIVTHLKKVYLKFNCFAGRWEHWWWKYGSNVMQTSTGAHAWKRLATTSGTDAVEEKTSRSDVGRVLLARWVLSDGHWAS